MTHSRPRGNHDRASRLSCGPRAPAGGQGLRRGARRHVSGRRRVPYSGMRAACRCRALQRARRALHSGRLLAPSRTVSAAAGTGARTSRTDRGGRMRRATFALERAVMLAVIAVLVAVLVARAVYFAVRVLMFGGV